MALSRIQSMLAKAITAIVDGNYRFRYYIAIILWIFVVLLTAAILGDWIQWTKFSAYGYVGIFVASLLNGAALVFGGPSQILTFAAGHKLPPVTVGIVSGTGTSIGELTGYFLGKGGSTLISHSLYSRIENFKNSSLFSLFIRHTFISLFVLALIPNPIFDFVSIVSGALSIRLHRYFLPVFCGKLLRFVGIALLGEIILNR